MDAGLKAVVGADVQGFVSGMQTATGASETFQNSVKKIGETFDIQNTALNQSVAFTKQLANADVDAAEGARKFAEAQRDLAKANEEANNSGGVFLGGISKQRVALVDMARIATGTGFTIRSLGSQLALFPLPVVAVVAALGYLIAEFIKLDNAIPDITAVLSDSGSEFTKATISVDDLKEHVQLAKEGFLNKDQVLKEYNDTLGKTIGKALNLGDVEKKLAQEGDAYIKFTLLKAAANVAYGKSADAAFQVALDAAKKTQEFQTLATNASVFGQGQSSAPGFVPGQDPLGGLKARADAANKAKQEAIDAGKKTVDDMKKIGDDFNKQAAEIAKSEGFNFFEKIFKDKTGKTIQDDNLQYLEKVKVLIESLSKKDTNPLFKDFAESADGELGKINFQLYQDHLKKATADAAKGAITADTFAQYSSALTNAFNKVANPNLKSAVVTNVDVSNVEDGIGLLDKKLKSDPKAFLHLTIGGINQDSYQASLDALAEIGKKFGAAFSSALSNAVNQGIEGISGALSSHSPIFQVLGRVLGNALKAIGQAYVAAALATAAAKKAFESLLISNPYLAVAAGIGLEIVGASLAASIGKTKAFALGGIVTGPTNALIGEAGPEVVFPLDKLNRFINRNTNNSPQMAVSGRLELRGNDLVAALARAKTSQGRVS